MRIFVCAAALAAMASRAVAIAAEPAMTAPMTAIAWTPYELELRSGSKIPGEVGILQVPRVRSDPNSGTVGLRFVRLRSTGGNGPPVVYLAGGPGSSGVEAAQGDRWALFDRLRKHGDVILLDQRGTGLSDTPPECSRPWSFPAGEASTAASIGRSVEAAVRTCAAEWRAAGVRLDAFTTAENAADVAALIRALGVPKANLVGISYGTFLGFAILRDHGALIDRAVFAGTEGPDHTVKLPLQIDTTLERLSRHLAGAAADTAGRDSLQSQLRRVFDRLGKAPVEVRTEDGKRRSVSLYDVQVVSFFLMGSSNNWPRLQSLAAAMDKGDFQAVPEMLGWLERIYGVLPAMPFAMDAVSPSSPQRLREVERQARVSLFGNAPNFPDADLREALGLRELPSRYRTPLRSDVPALFISGVLDPRTPPENADEVRQGFRRQAHLVIEGAGHDNDLFLSTPIILDRIDEFLSGGPLRDERVRADPPSAE